MAVGPKTKRRNSEKRKEHSRDAARCRRSREAEVFLNLSQEIPLSYDLVKVLDKTSIIRLTITYLKLRALFSDDQNKNGSHNKAAVDHLERKLDQLCQRALDGFLMVIANDGDVLYVTDNIAGFLGLTQVDVMGQSIFDLSHPCDHDELREMIGAKSHQPSDRAIFIRMKSTITSKGRNVHIKSASYKVIKCTGHLKRAELSSAEERAFPFVVIIGQTIAHPSNVEVALDNRTFLSRHSLDMKFTACDESIRDLIGYSADDVIGKSMYSFYHALDTDTLERAFKTLFCKGQACTGLYRFLAQRGGYIWVETHATVVNYTVTDKPEHVSCIHYVISGVEDRGVPYDTVQLSSKMSSPSEASCIEQEDDDDLPIKICPDRCGDDDDDDDHSCIQFATEEILAQVVREKQESDLLSNDLSLYSVNKSLVEKIHNGGSVNEGDIDDEDRGMTKNFSNISLTSLFDKIDDGLEMRAPYISMDDLVFSSGDTPLSQSDALGSHLSSIMNSDPLLSSVGHKSLPDQVAIPPPMFTVDLADSKLPPRKSFGVKRSYAGPDVSHLPCKAPRLELDLEPPPYVEPRTNCSSACTVPNYANTVSATVVHTATSGDVSLPMAGGNVMMSSEGKQVTFLHGADSSKTSGEQEADETPVSTVYLVWNKQKDGLEIFPSDLAGGKVRPETQPEHNEGLIVHRSAPNLDQSHGKAADQVVLINNGNFTGIGKLVLGTTSPGGGVSRMVFRGGAPNVGSVVPGGGMTVVDSGSKPSMSVHLDGKDGDCQITTVSSAIGETDDSFLQQVDRRRPLDLNLTNTRPVQLISPSVRKTAYVIPTEKISTIVGQLLPKDSADRNLQNGSRFFEKVMDSGRTHPLHLKVQSAVPGTIGRLTLARPLPNPGFLKRVLSDSVTKTAAKMEEDSAINEAMILPKAISSGYRAHPLFLLKKNNAQLLSQPVVTSVATSGNDPSQNSVFSAGLLTAQLQRSATSTTAGFVRPFNPPKVVVSRQVELQQVVPQRNESYASMRQENREEPGQMGPVYIQPLASSYQDVSGSSVLMNLLMKGVDVNYGYRLESNASRDVAK